jgi:hypothetical protein
MVLTTKETTAQPKEEPFTVEYYYKIKWGYANDFIDLWKKNHFPLQKKALENGEILSITAEKPIMHSGEDTRWDFKVRVVYRNAILGIGHEVTDQYKKQLFPDSSKLTKDEKYRFELVLAHWDVIVDNIELK